MSEITIAPLNAAHIDALADLLIETVANGGSVSFMHPLSRDDARAFWEKSLAAAARGERIVLGALDKERPIATVTLALDCPPNQPHRAEIAKMMTAVAYRKRGIASQLLQAAEHQAISLGRSMLVLDTATDDGAAGLYEKHGYHLTGEIPFYALKPHGGLTGTLIYWKKIA